VRRRGEGGATAVLERAARRVRAQADARSHVPLALASSSCLARELPGLTSLGCNLWAGPGGFLRPAPGPPFHPAPLPPACAAWTTASLTATSAASTASGWTALTGRGACVDRMWGAQGEWDWRACLDAHGLGCGGPAVEALRSLSRLQELRVKVAAGPGGAACAAAAAVRRGTARHAPRRRTRPSLQPAPRASRASPVA
jgi:hypothetical protein